MPAVGKHTRTLHLFLALLASIAPGHCRLGAQNLPIAIDGQFQDWTEEATAWVDATGDGNSTDLLRLYAANDENYLFLRLELDQDILLTENNPLVLLIDTDNNPLTGKVSNGIGAELEIKFGDRSGNFYFGNASYNLSLYQVDFHHLPTVSSREFEMAIGRNVVLAGSIPLFQGNVIRLAFRYGAGDQFPDSGSALTYEFNNEPVEALTPVALDKEDEAHIRLLTWNVLSDGLDDFDRAPRFRNVLEVLRPDVVTFNECWDQTSSQVASFMNLALPLGNFQSWKSVKADDGNVTVSRYPILQHWNFYPGHRLTAVLLDLPDDQYPKDLLVINAHLRCCSGGNYFRQLEADAFAAFIQDAKTPGGEIDLPENTPFVLSGDLNLVGWQQQLTTLLAGEVVNTGFFGSGGAPDWDGTDLLDVIAIQTDQRMAYTWRKSSSEYPPSRLDYHICSNSVLNVEKAFTLNTEVMPLPRLQQYGLDKFDTRIASDHLPRVTDFSISTASPVSVQVPAGRDYAMRIAPNPATDLLRISYEATPGQELHFRLMDVHGRLHLERDLSDAAGEQTMELGLSGLPPGVYLAQLIGPGGSQQTILIKQ